LDILATIGQYKNHLKVAGYAAATIDGYRKGLDQFSGYLAGRGVTDLRTVTHQVIVAYQEAVMAESNAMETKALKLRPVKRLFEHLVATHKLLINPAEGIVETCRKNRKIGIVLTTCEVKKLMAQPNLSLRTGIRDRAVMEVLYSTAIRLEELLHLEIYHADFKDKMLYIRKAKGNKQRVVPLGKTAAAFLREYLEKIRPHYARKNVRQRRLFLLNTGEALTPAAIRAALGSYRISAGIKKPVSPHTLRRTCATHLLQAGADIRYIQKLLGHRHLSTTQSYTKIMPGQVKKTHEKTHPGVKEDSKHHADQAVDTGLLKAFKDPGPVLLHD
jgi:integrase/recombinase XerD